MGKMLDTSMWTAEDALEIKAIAINAIAHPIKGAGDDWLQEQKRQEALYESIKKSEDERSKKETEARKAFWENGN